MPLANPPDRPGRLLWTVAGSSSVTWANQPAAASHWAGLTTYTQTMDLRPYSLARILVTKGAIASVAGATYWLAYWDGGAYVAITPALVADTAATPFISAYLAIPAGARVQNALLAVWGAGGDGVVDPTFTAIVAEFM